MFSSRGEGQLMFNRPYGHRGHIAAAAIFAALAGTITIAAVGLRTFS
jgi:hypothetical protein